MTVEQLSVLISECVARGITHHNCVLMIKKGNKSLVVNLDDLVIIRPQDDDTKPNGKLLYESLAFTGHINNTNETWFEKEETQ